VFVLSKDFQSFDAPKTSFRGLSQSVKIYNFDVYEIEHFVTAKNSIFRMHRKPAVFGCVDCDAEGNVVSSALNMKCSRAPNASRLSAPKIYDFLGASQPRKIKNFSHAGKNAVFAAEKM